MAGFVFDADGVSAVLEDLRQLRADLVEDARLADRLQDVVGPGDEPASQLMADSARSSGAAFHAHNLLLRAFVDGYVGRLTASRDEYFRTDDSGRDRFEGARHHG